MLRNKSNVEEARPSKRDSLFQDIRNMILVGGYSDGDKFLSENELADRFKVSRTIVRETCELFVDKGILEKVVGAGTYVKSRDKLNGSIIHVFIPCIAGGKLGVYGNMARGIEDTANELGYSVVISNTDNQVEKALDYVEKLDATNGAGVIFAPLQVREFELANGQVLDCLRSKRLKTVFLDNHIISERDIPYVVSDSYGGMMQMASHLISLGHKRIGYIGVAGSLNERLRQRGYLAALRENGIDADPCMIKLSNENDVEKMGVTEAAALLEERELPSAIICHHDIIAYNVIDFLSKKQLRVPEDISVTGFDDLPFASMIKPALTTVRQQWWQMGAEAVKVLCGQNSSAQVILETELVVRESSGSPSVPRASLDKVELVTKP